MPAHLRRDDKPKGNEGTRGLGKMVSTPRKQIAPDGLGSLGSLGPSIVVSHKATDHTDLAAISGGAKTLDE